MGDDEKIMSIDDVVAVIPKNITKSWIYSNWERLGGVVISRRKLILEGVLYDHLRAKGMALCEGNSKRRDMGASKGRYGANSVENKNAIERIVISL